MRPTKVLVCGAGGFIGTHLVENLKNQGLYVIGADLKQPEFSLTVADEFYTVDLCNTQTVNELITSDIDTVYQLAADMGGAGYIFSGDNDSAVMSNSGMININVATAMRRAQVSNLFFTSSACVYPQQNQICPDQLIISEQSAYPANPDSEYGWEKFFSERLYLSYARNYGLRVRIARLHNVFGPRGAWKNGREKAPAALCRKVAESKNNEVEVWGTGQQLRSFLYIDQCIQGINKIQQGDYAMPLNLGSDRIISIDDMCRIIAQLAKKQIQIHHRPGPVGVACRSSDNTLIKKQLGWSPDDKLEYGLAQTYCWITEQIQKGIKQ